MPFPLSQTLWSLQPEATQTAQEAAKPSGGGAPVPACGEGMGALAPLVLMFALLYFLLIRPQQKRQKETETMLKGLRVGDLVRTTGGIRGEIMALRDNDLDLLIADRVRVNVLRSHISAKETKESPVDKGKA